MILGASQSRWRLVLTLRECQRYTVTLQGYYSSHLWTTGIQRKWEWQWERNMGMETCKNHCSLDSSQVRFTELYKPSHWYAIVVKFFLKLFLLHKALTNKRPYKKYINWSHLWSIIIMQFFYLITCLTITARVCYNCYKIWLNDLKFQCRNNRCLW